MGCVGVVQRCVVGVLRPGNTMFSSCCRLLAAPPTPTPTSVGAGDTLDEGGMPAGEDTGVATPTVELGRVCGDMLRAMGDICGLGEAWGCGDSCGDAWGKGVL